MDTTQTKNIIFTWLVNNFFYRSSHDKYFCISVACERNMNIDTTQTKNLIFMWLMNKVFLVHSSKKYFFYKCCSGKEYEYGYNSNNESYSINVQAAAVKLFVTLATGARGLVTSRKDNVEIK